MTITYTVIITADPESPGWWNAEVPALPGCVSCGQSYEEAMEKIREAMADYIAVSQDVACSETSEGLPDQR
jgi:predicted RNase H-like HicB family nuclease